MARIGTPRKNDAAFQKNRDHMSALLASLEQTAERTRSGGGSAARKKHQANGKL